MLMLYLSGDRLVRWLISITLLGASHLVVNRFVPASFLTWRRFYHTLYVDLINMHLGSSDPLLCAKKKKKNQII
jgi:hypothetical protein